MLLQQTKKKKKQKTRIKLSKLIMIVISFGSQSIGGHKFYWMAGSDSASSESTPKSWAEIADKLPLGTHQPPRTIVCAGDYIFAAKVLLLETRWCFVTKNRSPGHKLLLLLLVVFVHEVDLIKCEP